MCFIWIPEQADIISLYSINWHWRRSVFFARQEFDPQIVTQIDFRFEAPPEWQGGEALNISDIGDLCTQKY